MSNIFNNLISAKFWFSTPLINSKELIVYFFVFLALVILWLICYIYFTGKSKVVKPYRNLKESIGWLLGFGILGLLLVFFAWQAIPYLSVRILFIIIFIAIIFWLIYKILNISKFKTSLEEFEEVKKREKYLPRKKSK